MCLWLLTACLGLLPSSPTPTTVVIVQGVPTPILQPTAAPTTTTAAPTTTTAAPTMTTVATTTTAATTTTTTTTTTTPRPTTAAPATTTTTAAPATTTTTAAPATTTTTAAPATTTTTTAAPTTTTTTPRPTSGNNLTTLLPPTATTNTSSQTVNVINSREELLPVVICNNPDVICLSNPDDNASGPLAIDPRLGTTPAASAALQVPPITGYSAQLPSYDTAVRFPRERRSIKRRIFNKQITLMDIIKSTQSMTDDKHNIKKRQSCRCVAAGTCVNNNGAGMIDFRIVTPTAQCPAGQVYCCGSTMITCGSLQTVPATSVAPAPGQASFGEFPWQAMVLTKQNDYVAGGVLINQLNVLTVTHRVNSYIVSGTAPNLKVRLGEWDAAGTYEPVPFQEYTIQKVFSHPSYNANTLQYDLTVLRLSTSVPLTPMTGSAPTINRACLPPSSTTAYTGQRCWVSGWGKDMFGLQGQFQQILKKVDVPIVAPAPCQTQLQTARLGSTFVLDTTSFICAGGEANKDACTGDGGSGLVCQVNGQWVLVGLVAWGLGCSNANVPAAYVNVAALLPWIQQQVAAA